VQGSGPQSPAPPSPQSLFATFIPVAIRASSSKLIDSLIADLAGGGAAAREAAVARLTLAGPRAVERLAALAGSDSASPPARGAALRALEAIGDPRALTPALEILSNPRADATLGVAATSVARVFLNGARGAAAVDRLTAAALDRARPDTVRLAALRALRDLKPKTIAPLLRSLAADPSAAIRADAAAKKKGRAAAPDPMALLAGAAEQGLADEAHDATTLQRALAEAGDSAPLPDLHRLIERIREREALEPVSRQTDWTAARAAVHVALANRGSRLALYDLRESLRAEAPLPADFITALTVVGDASCLEAIAGAHAKTRHASWRNELAGAFKAIVAREKLTKRHAAVMKIAQRSPRTLDALWPGRSRGSRRLVR
jgi:HEAT repeat protein